MSLRPPFGGDPATTLVHVGRGPAANDKVMSSTLQLLKQVSVFGGNGRVASGDAAVVVGGTMLPNMLVRRAVDSPVVRGQLGEKGEAVSRAVSSEYDDGFVHPAAPAASSSCFFTKFNK